MEDQNLGTVAAKSEDGSVVDHDPTPSLDSDSEQNPPTADVTDEVDTSGEMRESSPEDQPKFPIFQKIDDLSIKIQTLKKEQKLLSKEVKAITNDSLPNTEVLNAFQNLSSETGILKRKYFEECSERKRLYNELIELKGNIRVFCRCRPLNENEVASGSTPMIDFDSCNENELQIICSDSLKKHFKFDHVFKPEDSQETVFAQTSPIVTSVLDGYNVCIFAYGQTGTGKTFTMEGKPENRGVNYRTLEELFRLSEERCSIMKYELFVSMLEVYNEKIRDLLVDNSNQPTKKLEIKQAAEGTQDVPGLVETRVYATSEVWELLKSGSRVRSVGSTNANELSSRSHCLLRVTIKGENVVDGQRTKSHLWLVDLAGSERVGRIEVEGERLKESQFINKSLSALGDVISALATKTAHVPYRNSKLTHLLQSSLGGDCKTLMFVQISPSIADSGETLCSLNFASRVRGIEQGPARKQPEMTELFKYKQMADKLKQDEKEMKKLQDNVQSLQLRLSARDHVCRSLQDKVRDLEIQLVDERKTRLKQENRSIAAVSVKSSAVKLARMPTITEKKPPLAPVKQRLPLRGITNFLPPSPYGARASTSFLQPLMEDSKENPSRTIMAAAKAKTLMQARRGSIVTRPPQTVEQQSVHKPRRRASIATFRPERSELNPHMMTPAARVRNSRVGRQSFVWDPQRMWRTSKVSSPLPGVKTLGAAKSGEATPTGSNGFRFMGSPPVQASSSKVRPPTYIALQRKPVVWSPMKQRGFKGNRRSLLPS